MKEEVIDIKFEFSNALTLTYSNDYTSSDTYPLDFSSKSGLASTIAEQTQEWQSILTTLKREISCSYLLLGILSDKAPFICVAFSLEWLCKQVENQLDIDRVIHTVITNWQSEHSLFKSRYRSFLKEYHNSTQQNLLIKSYFFRLVYDFTVELQSQRLNEEFLNFKLIELKKILEIEKQITMDLQKPIVPVKEMARMAGMSVSKFKTLFFELYNTSPHQYILEKKLIYARELLQSGQYTITQISYKLGYNHPSGFSRIYRKKFNYSPTVTYATT